MNGEAFESLSSVCEAVWSRYRVRPTLRVDSEMFQALHENPDGTFHQFFEQHIQRLSQMDSRSEVKCEEVFSVAARGVQKVVPGEFMGPMCSPLTKVNMRHLVEQECLITEKSDGLRCILVAKHVPQFPMWYARRIGDVSGSSPHDGRPEFPDMLTFSFLESLLLEAYRAELLTQNELEIPSMDLGGLFAQSRLCSSFAEQGAAEGVECFRIDLSEAVSRCGTASAAGNRVSYRVERSRRQGRWFTYLFDRGMKDTHLLLEQLVFPGLHDLVLDGELLSPIHNPTGLLIFAAFDMFSFTPMQPDSARPSLETKELTYHTMQERYDLLTKVAVGPYTHLYIQQKILPPPSTLHVVGKRMYPLSQMEEVVSKLHRMEDGKYSFAGITYNDGLIFTPNKFDLCAGAAEFQFKWKWPEALTIDWLLTRQTQSSATSKGAEKKATASSGQTNLQPSYAMELFFRKKRTDSATHKVVGETRGHSYFATASILNSKKLTFTGPTIVECGWDHHSGQWTMERVRKDKQEANSVVAALAVMESICENITLPWLVKDISRRLEEKKRAERDGGEGEADVGEQDEGTDGERRIAPGPGPTGNLLASTNEEQKISTSIGNGDDSTCSNAPIKLQKVDPLFFILRCTYEKDGTTAIRLQWTVKLPAEKHPIVCNHCRVTDSCFGFRGLPSHEEDPASKLEGTLAILLANDGGCYAWSDTTIQAQFDPARGLWELGPLSREKNRATATAVMRHLQFISKCAAKPGLRIVPLNSTPQVKAIGSSATEPSTAPAAETTEEDQTEIEDQESRLVFSNQHYAERAQALNFVEDRTALRRHNNWIKSMLIHTAVQLAQQNLLAKSTVAKSEMKKVSVLELCCGRGGDLSKWKEQPVQFLMMVDSCFEAVAAAAKRYCVANGLSTRVQEGKPGYPGIEAYFHVADCFGKSLHKIITAQKQRRHQLVGDGFDIVSCQYSMHYAFSSEEKVRNFLGIVAMALKPGGVFIATTPDDEKILSYAPSFENASFRIDFLDDVEAKEHSSYGRPYRVSYDVGVDEEIEFVVEWHRFVALAAEFSLQVEDSRNFKSFREQHRSNAVAQRLWDHHLGKQGRHHQQRVAQAATSTNPDKASGAGNATDTRKRGRDDEAVDAESTPLGIDFTQELTPDELEATEFYRALVLRKGC
jgi:SAM-dependent methyltransferase